jgi:hypothetical protein
MDTTSLNSKFGKIGARLKLVDAADRDYGLFRINVLTDRHGEFFEMRPQINRGQLGVEVLDLQPRDRHLLLLIRDGSMKHKYLCGHDERHWFVAGVPTLAAVGNVQQAMHALQPEPVQARVAAVHLKSAARYRRKNRAFKRQGEWFFLPEPELIVPVTGIILNEPLSRGNGSKPHWAEQCFRLGGEEVYVCKRYPLGLTPSNYDRLLKREPETRNWSWRRMFRNPTVYVRGRISHPDHATIVLQVWHRVVMNTENLSHGMRNVAFLD